MKENREKRYKRLTADGKKISSLVDESQKLFHAMVGFQLCICVVCLSTLLILAKFIPNLQSNRKHSLMHLDIC